MTGHNGSRTPLVSAVIPTRGRADLVVRAVRSALAQTLTDLEVVVVIDGPDAETEAALHRIAEPRLRVLALPARSGPAAARNTGVQEARGEWIAFLDDDDEWLPEKLCRQLEAARASTAPVPIISCQVIARTGRGEFVWPRLFPRPEQDLSDYLLDRRGPFSRPGFVGTPTIFTSRDLLLKVPVPNWPVHEDWAWLLDANAEEGAVVDFVRHPLCIVNVDEDRPSQWKIDDWQISLHWIRAYRERVTPNAYSAFVTSKVAGMARRQSQWRAFWPLLVEAFTAGSPKFRHLLIYFGIWMLTPAGTRRLQRHSFSDGAQSTPARPRV